MYFWDVRTADKRAGWEREVDFERHPLHSRPGKRVGALRISGKVCLLFNVFSGDNTLITAVSICISSLD